jgi:branched-chain amino acid transport system ATP-binding protein
MTNDLLVVDGVAKRYGSLVVTDQLSFSVREGEAVGIIGPNGAGKTTLFNIISGGVRPDAGRVIFRGEDISTLAPPSRCQRGIGRSYQVPHPFTKMTVYENVLVGATFGARLPEKEAEDLCLDVLERTGLIAKANHKSGSLSLLDRKRLELARAMGTRPRLLLLDEIAGGLTEREVGELIETINEVRAEGVSILWIEHLMHALLAVVDRIVALNFGALIAEGRPAEVLADPKVRQIYMGVGAA